MMQEPEKKLPESPEKNIQLTLMRPGTERNEIKLDLREVAEGLKRFLALWIALALGCGAVIAGAGIFLRHTAYAGDAMALIGVDMAPVPVEKTETDEKGEEVTVIEYYIPTVDVTRLQDAMIVERAMVNQGLNVKDLDKVRHGLSIASVLTDDQYEQQTLYRSLLEKNNVTLETVQSILAGSDQATRYVVSLDYRDLGYSRRAAQLLLNEILLSYRADFEQTQNAIPVLGSAAAAVDLSSYDLSEIPGFFSVQLDNVLAYLQDCVYFRETGVHWKDAGLTDFDGWFAEASRGMTQTFRSRKTGYSLEDLLRRAGTLRNTELVRFTAFVNMNGLSDHPEIQAERFRWLRSEQERSREAILVQADALKAAAAGYEKAPQVYIGNVTGNINQTSKDVILDEQGELEYGSLGAYDKMIIQQMNLRNQAAGFSTLIAYYGSLAEKLGEGRKTGDADRAKADALREAFSAKLKKLLEDLSVTMEEYSREAVKANAMNILVPATSKLPGLTAGGWMQILMYAEIGLLAAYLAAALIYGLSASNPRRKHAAAEA